MADTVIDYNKVLARFADYRSSDFKDMHGLSRSFTNRGFERITQARTTGCHCSLREQDLVVNFVENRVVGGLAEMLPPGATDREVVDEVFLGDISLASLIHRASDEQWSRVINGRGRHAAQEIFRLVSGSAANFYHIRLIDHISGNLLHGFITKNRGSDNIESYLHRTYNTSLTVWYGYERDTEMRCINITL